ncbi:hypothetical protein M2281_001113 [Mesorhizobium soli]|uniref:glutelin n=1 Tax=Pseudaminobacter soli (ex Li et al. 2025) TaxID=1295366 RepID=UPI002473EF85|nr:glutelin [Mesorhizobium soli]MDH6230541.1 hypothetical protein [Mesorhizobium soli]
MRNRMFFAAALLTGLALPMAAGGAQAAGFECAYNEAPNAPKDLPPVKGLEENMTQLDARRRLAEMVGNLTTAKIAPAMIVDHLVWAYCPLVANDPRLSDTEKTDLVRRFAGQVAALAYTAPGGGEIDVLVDLPLAPAILGRVDDAAKAAGISRDEWLQNTIDQSLNNPSGSPAK